MRAFDSFVGACKKHKWSPFRSLKIRKRLMLFFCIIVIIPLLTISIISYISFSSYVEDLMVKNKIDISINAMQEISLIKIRDEKLSDQILLNQNIQLALSNNQYSDAITRYTRTKAISSYLSSLTDENNIKGIDVLGENGDEFISPIITISLKKSLNAEDILLNERVEKSRGDNVWVPLVKDIFDLPYSTVSKRPYIYLVRKINNINYIRRRIGVSVIQLKYESIAGILQRTCHAENESSALIDKDGVIMAHTSKSDLLGSKLEGDIFNKIKGEENIGTFRHSIDGKKYLILFIKDKSSGWSIIQNIPYSNITAKSKQIRSFTFAIMLVCLGIGIILSVLFSKNITKPIIKLKSAMEKFAGGSLNQRLNIETDDEIGQLQRSFNHMTREINSLMESADSNHKKMRAMELKVMEYQINPHFLYNTLDSINWMAQMSGQKKVGEMVTALARFFRIGLNNGKEYVKIRDEVEHANNYIIISKMRFKDCFDYKFNIDESILEYKTIKIILQPIIENAIKYGVNKKIKGGFIEVNGNIDNNSIIFEIRDNGQGIPEEKLAAIKKGLSICSDREIYDGGVGLCNVNERIKLNYGSDYGLDIESLWGEGTTVRIIIPATR